MRSCIAFLVGVLIVAVPAFVFASHPEQDRCDYLASEIADLQYIYSNQPEHVMRYLPMLRDLRLEFEKRRCPLTSAYLMHSNGYVKRQRQVIASKP